MAPAAVSVALAGMTVRGAMAFAGKQGSALSVAGVSAKVMALAEGMTEGLAVAKLKVGLVLLIAFGVVAAGAGAVAHQVLGAKQPEAGQEAGPQPLAVGVGQTKPEGEKQQVRTDRYGDPLPPGAVARLGT